MAAARDLVYLEVQARIYEIQALALGSKREAGLRVCGTAYRGRDKH